MLLLIELAHTAAERVYNAIVSGQQDAPGQAEPVLLPILQPYNTVGDTGGISYHTSKDTYKTGDKCHLSHVVKDSNWEETAAKALEWLPQVKAYVKNVTKLDWFIPYTFGGQERRYLPDFVVKLDDGKGDPLNLIIEVSGAQRDDKDAKVDQVEKLWIPAINNDGRFGRWGFLEVKDPFLVGKALEGFITYGDKLI
jgi:type III restriction enzyme